MFADMRPGLLSAICLVFIAGTQSASIVQLTSENPDNYDDSYAFLMKNGMEVNKRYVLGDSDLGSDLEELLLNQETANVEKRSFINWFLNGPEKEPQKRSFVNWFLNGPKKPQKRSLLNWFLDTPEDGEPENGESHSVEAHRYVPNKRSFLQWFLTTPRYYERPSEKGKINY